MKNWEEKVTKIELKELVSFSSKYDYLACFDENGTASATLQMYKSLMKNEIPDEDRRYFTLTCCLFSREEYKHTEELIDKLKDEYFHDDKDSIVLHTRDISKKLGPFNFKNVDKSNAFISSLSETINRVNCKIISITFDLYAYVKQGYTHDPYQVAFDIILEGLFKVVEPDTKTALLFEARGKNEDKALFKHVYKILNITGTKRIKKRNT